MNWEAVAQLYASPTFAMVPFYLFGLCAVVTGVFVAIVHPIVRREDEDRLGQIVQDRIERSRIADALEALARRAKLHPGE